MSAPTAGHQADSPTLAAPYLDDETDRRLEGRRHVVDTNGTRASGIILPTRTTKAEVEHAFGVAEQAWGRVCARLAVGEDVSVETEAWRKARQRAVRMFDLLCRQMSGGGR